MERYQFRDAGAALTAFDFDQAIGRDVIDFF